MEGKILRYDAETKEGLISDAQGERVVFSVDEWESDTPPREGQLVNFIVNDDGKASSILTTGPLKTSKSKWVAALLAFILGAVGAHKFYLGRTSAGFIMLGIWLFGLLLFAIPSMIMGLIAFIECVIYLFKSPDDFEKDYVVSEKSWF